MRENEDLDPAQRRLNFQSSKVGADHAVVCCLPPEARSRSRVEHFYKKAASVTFIDLFSLYKPNLALDRFTVQLLQWAKDNAEKKRVVIAHSYNVIPLVPLIKTLDLSAALLLSPLLRTDYTMREEMSLEEKLVHRRLLSAIKDSQLNSADFAPLLSQQENFRFMLYIMLQSLNPNFQEVREATRANERVVGQVKEAGLRMLAIVSKD